MTTKARLHWFWRVLLAVFVGAVGSFLIFLAMEYIAWRPHPHTWLFVRIVIVSLPGIITYALLTFRFGPPPPDGETHCRRCDHILRGLSEPRCSECGEAI